MSGFSQTNIRVGDTFTVVAPESFTHSSDIYVIKQYIWSGLDPAYFKVEYDQSHFFSYEYSSTRIYYSEGINVAKVTLLQPFQGTMTLNCTVTGLYHGFGVTRNQTYYYTFSCAPVDVTVYPSDITMDVGQTETLQWQFAPSNTQYGATVSFSSSDKNIVDVDLYGKITARGVGTATITATTNYFTTATCQVTVKPTLATSISLDQINLSIPVGSSQKIAATVMPTIASDKTVTWTSSNEGVATVDANGNVTGISMGTATITATTNDGSNLSAVCSIVVTKKSARSVTLDKTELEMSAGQSYKLTATILPADASQRVTWSSSDTSVAKVIGGTVYAQNIGECMITVRTTDGSNLSADCLILVYPEGEIPNPTQFGDMNGDNEVNITDVVKLANQVMGN